MSIWKRSQNGATGPTGAAGALVYDSGGLVANAKIWSGTVTTNASGAWSVDYTAAGFTETPRIQATCFTAGTTAASVANAKTAAKSLTAASGVVAVPALAVLGILSVTLAGAGISVDVVAIGK